jgi:hypothetical protein
MSTGILLRHKPTGTEFRGHYVNPTRHSPQPHYEDIDGNRYELVDCEAADDPTATWHECPTCGHRWVAGMHGGHDCVGRLRSKLAAVEAERDGLREERDSLQTTFDLRWKADRRATSRWQEATGEVLTWPDHADLCAWLLEEVDRLRTWEVVELKTSDVSGFIVRRKVDRKLLNIKGEWGVVPLLFVDAHLAEKHACAKLGSMGGFLAKEIAQLRAELSALRQAAERAKRELECIIGQATARGWTSGGPKRVVAALTAALTPAADGEANHARV